MRRREATAMARESENIYPIKRRIETEDGWILEADYGPKQGVSRSVVHMPPPDTERAAKTRAAIAAAFAAVGYRLLEDVS